MPRSKSSVTKKARVRKVLSATKGYYGRRKNLYTIGKQSVVRSQMFAFIHRRKKKGDFRRLWIVRINAALAPLGISYSRFVHALDAKHIKLNRKSLSFLAARDEEGFKQLVEHVSPQSPKGASGASSA